MTNRRNIEIERKYLIDKAPRFASRYKGTMILQGYIGDGKTELRLRKYGKRYFATVKAAKGLKRLNLAAKGKLMHSSLQTGLARI